MRSNVDERDERDVQGTDAAVAAPVSLVLMLYSERPDPQEPTVA